MATKPSTVVEWGTAQSNETTPTGGQIASGIAAGEAANSSRMNYLLRFLGLWTAYLNDGAMSGAWTFGSTVGITGNTTVGGTLGVTGLITATAGLTAAANQDIKTSGTGRHKHGTMTLMIPALVGMGVSNDDTADPYRNINSGGATAGGGVEISNDGTVWTVPITLPLGKRVTAIRGRIQDDSATPTTARMAVWRWDYSGSVPSPLQLGATQTSLGNDTIQTLTVSGLTYTIVTLQYLVVHFSPSNSTGVIQYYYVEVDYDDL